MMGSGDRVMLVNSAAKIDQHKVINLSPHLDGEDRITDLCRSTRTVIVSMSIWQFC